METDALNTTFSALSDPTRRAILARLALGKASVGDLAAPFNITLPSISRHLKVLEQAQLIRRDKDAQRRICHLRGERLQQASDWIAHYRSFWTDRFDALGEYLDGLNQADGGPEASDRKD